MHAKHVVVFFCFQVVVADEEENHTIDDHVDTNQDILILFYMIFILGIFKP
jgi:hypothetical protein